MFFYVFVRILCLLNFSDSNFFLGLPVWKGWAARVKRSAINVKVIRCVHILLKYSSQPPPPTSQLRPRYYPHVITPITTTLLRPSPRLFLRYPILLPTIIRPSPPPFLNYPHLITPITPTILPPITPTFFLITQPYYPHHPHLFPH